MLTNGQWIGQPFRLQAWQRRLIYELFEVGADDMRRYRTRGASVKVNAVLSEPPRYVNAPKDVGEQLWHASVAICPSLQYLEQAWQDAVVAEAILARV